MKVPASVRKFISGLADKKLGAVVVRNERTIRVLGAYLPPPDNRLVSVCEVEEDRCFEKLPNIPWTVRSYVVRSPSGPLHVCHDCGQMLVSACKHYGNLDAALAHAVAECMVATLEHDDLIPEAQA